MGQIWKEMRLTRLSSGPGSEWRALIDSPWGARRAPARFWCAGRRSDQRQECGKGTTDAARGEFTLARRLGEVLALPVVRLDDLFWQPGWVAPPPETWQARVQQLVHHEQWILDGNYTNTLDLRLAAADAVVFLDLPRWICLRRIILRTLRSYGRERADAAPGCPERLTRSFLRWVWTYPRQQRPVLVSCLQHVERTTPIVQLCTRKEIRAFLKTVGSRKSCPRREERAPALSR